MFVFKFSSFPCLFLTVLAVTNAGTNSSCVVFDTDSCVNSLNGLVMGSHCYITVDGKMPNASEASADITTEFFSIPNGFVVSPVNNESLSVIASNSWGSSCLVADDNSAFFTSPRSSSNTSQCETSGNGGLRYDNSTGVQRVGTDKFASNYSVLLVAELSTVPCNSSTAVPQTAGSAAPLTTVAYPPGCAMSYDVEICRFVHGGQPLGGLCYTVLSTIGKTFNTGDVYPDNDSYQAIPDGYRIAEDNEDSLQMANGYWWGSNCLVVADDSSYISLLLIASSKKKRAVGQFDYCESPGNAGLDMMTNATTGQTLVRTTYASRGDSVFLVYNMTKSLHCMTTGVQTTGIQTTGIQTTGVQTTGVQTTQVQTTDVQTTGIQTTNVQTTDVQTTNVQTTDVQTTVVALTGVLTTDAIVQTTSAVPFSTSQDGTSAGVVTSSTVGSNGVNNAANEGAANNADSKKVVPIVVGTVVGVVVLAAVIGVVAFLWTRGVFGKPAQDFTPI